MFMHPRYPDGIRRAETTVTASLGHLDAMPPIGRFYVKYVAVRES